MFNITNYRKGVTIKKNHEISFGKGNKDDWCVYIIKDGKWHIPKDIEYFTRIKELYDEYGERVYNSFLQVFNNVHKCSWDFNDRRLCEKTCKSVSSEYPVETMELWCIFFMTMVAEENMEGTVLGKNIKHLAIYNIFFDGWEIEKVTGKGNGDNGYMRNMKAKEIKKLCVERGILV